MRKSNRGRKFPPETLSKDEVKQLLDSFGETTVGVRNRALIATYLFSQVRCNEALNLRCCDLDLEGGTVTVLLGKRKKRRLAALGKQAVPYIEQWITMRPESLYFFCTQHGGRMCDSYVRRVVKRHAAKARIAKRVSCHNLRHTGSFHLANAGVDLRMLQFQLGHHSLAVTERYISHLCPAKMIDEIRKTDW